VQPRFVVMVFIPMRHAGRIFVQITAELSGCCSETFKRNLSSRDSVFPAPASCMASCGDSANLWKIRIAYAQHQSRATYWLGNPEGTLADRQSNDRRYDRSLSRQGP